MPIPIWNEEVERRFTYFPPNGATVPKYERIRAHAKELAYLILELVPESRERALALTKLEEVSMWANAGIARRT